MGEFNLLSSFPKCDRSKLIGTRTEKNRKIASKFDKEFFDGNRINGYGGYVYDGRWLDISEKIIERYSNPSTFLDVGCGKGFLVYDMLHRGVTSIGIDISKYAIENGMELVKPFMIIGNAEKLPWGDKTFDCIVSINTIHNLSKSKVKTAIKEMIRVCNNPKNMFIQVDAFRTKEEKKKMKSFNLTAKTILSTKDWIKLFKEIGYKGDYYWTII